MRYARFMKRTTVMLPDDVLARVRHESRRRGTSVADVVREAVEKHLPEPEAGKPLAFFAVGEGTEDGSERVDEHVAEAMGKGASRRG